MFKLLPNLLTILRFFLSLLGAYYLYKKSFFPSLLLYGTAFLTDFLDGYIARKFKVCSFWGTLLDPLADKVAIFSFLAVLLFGEFKYKPSLLIVSILFLKELVVVLGSILFLGRGVLPKPNLLGKTAVSLLFLYGIVLIWGNASGRDITFLKVLLEVAVLSTLLGALLLYLKEGKYRLKKPQRL